MAEAKDVARLVKSNGGRLIGKTRLQKSAYFLERLDAGFGFEFDYHHYGPYSDELASVTDDAQALGMVHIDWATSQEGARYAIFRDADVQSPEDDAADDHRRKILNVLGRYSALELELAATADYLATHGYSAQAWPETRRRKPAKFTADRAARAKRLLAELGLPAANG